MRSLDHIIDSETLGVAKNLRHFGEPLEPDPDHTGVGIRSITPYPIQRNANGHLGKFFMNYRFFAFLFYLFSIESVADIYDLSEIVVTAELRKNTLIDHSGSTTVLSERNLKQLSAQHLEDVLNSVPNLNFSGGTSRARFFQIRGIGERSQYAEPINASVGLLIDDIDFTGIGNAATMLDVAQVEILRGPQGTLHGANALAGLINVSVPNEIIPTSSGENRSITCFAT